MQSINVAHGNSVVDLRMLQILLLYFVLPMSCLNLTTMSMQISNSILGLVLGLGSEVLVSWVRSR